MALIREALDNRYRLAEQQREAEEQTRIAQKQADEARTRQEEIVRLGREVRAEAIELLDSHGSRVPQNAMGTRTKADRIYTAIGGWFLLPVMISERMTPLQYMDKTVLETDVPIEDSETSVKVHIICETAVPRKSPHVGIHVAGLGEWLSLRTGILPQILPEVYGPQSRNATSEEIQKFQEVVGMVKTIHGSQAQPPRR